MPATIQLRNVPEALHRRLKARAALAGMSLSDFLLKAIREAAERPSMEELRARVERRSGLWPSVPPAEIIRAERDRPVHVHIRIELLCRAIAWNDQPAIGNTRHGAVSHLERRWSAWNGDDMIVGGPFKKTNLLIGLAHGNRRTTADGHNPDEAALSIGEAFAIWRNCAGRIAISDDTELMRGRDVGELRRLDRRRRSRRRP